MSRQSTIITLQPSRRTDNIINGHEMTQLPYPFHVDAATGEIGRQDIWKGNPLRVYGFVEKLTNGGPLALTWEKAAKRPRMILNMYLITEDKHGHRSIHSGAIEEVLINGERQRYLVGGNGRWGQGLTLAEAKENFTRYGGQLSRGYAVVRFGSGSEFGGIDNMGRYHWAGDAPEVKTIPARKSRAVL